jgi:hypothetical protein
MHPTSLYKEEGYFLIGLANEQLPDRQGESGWQGEGNLCHAGRATLPGSSGRIVPFTQTLALMFQVPA